MLVPVYIWILFYLASPFSCLLCASSRNVSLSTLGSGFFLTRGHVRFLNTLAKPGRKFISWTFRSNSTAHKCAYVVVLSVLSVKCTQYLFFKYYSTHFIKISHISCLSNSPTSFTYRFCSSFSANPPPTPNSKRVCWPLLMIYANSGNLHIFILFCCLILLLFMFVQAYLWFVLGLLLLTFCIFLID